MAETKALADAIKMAGSPYIKVKVTRFGRDWAQKEFGRGHTLRFLIGKVVQVDKENSKRVVVEWEDKSVMSTTVSHTQRVTKAVCKKAVKQAHLRGVS
jgi:hypothetical protein